MKEIEVLEKIKVCLKKAGMDYQLNVAIDPDEDGNCFFKDGYLYIDNRQTAFTAADIDSVKYKLFDYDDAEVYDVVSYIRIVFCNGDELYIHDETVCKDKYLYQYNRFNEKSPLYGDDAKKALFKQ